MARMKASGRLTVLFVALLFAAMPSRATGAEELNFRKNVGDFWVYLSVMPADFISGPAASAPGATPFQPPAARDTHHLMVAIFDYRTGRRITEATVEARVAALGFSGTKKALESTTLAGARLYAGAFPMQGRGPFRVNVEFRVPDSTHAQHTTFYFSHPSFAPPKAKAQKERKR